MELEPINTSTILTTTDPIPTSTLNVPGWIITETMEITFGDYAGRPDTERVQLARETLAYFFAQGWFVVAVVSSGSAGNWETVETNSASNTRTNDLSQHTGGTVEYTGDTTNTDNYVHTFHHRDEYSHNDTHHDNTSHTGKDENGSTTTVTEKRHDKSKSTSKSKDVQGSSGDSSAAGTIANITGGGGGGNQSLTQYASSFSGYNDGKNYAGSSGGATLTNASATDYVESEGTTESALLEASTTNQTTGSVKRGTNDNNEGGSTRTGWDDYTDTTTANNEQRKSERDLTDTTNMDVTNTGTVSDESEQERHVTQAYWSSWQKVRLQRKRISPNKVLESMVGELVESRNKGEKAISERYTAVISLYSTMLSKSETELGNVATEVDAFKEMMDGVMTTIKDTLTAISVTGNDDKVNEAAEYQRTVINEKFDALIAGKKGELITAGLFNSTQWTMVVAGIERERGVALLAVSDKVLGWKRDLAATAASLAPALSDAAKAIYGAGMDGVLKPTQMRNEVLKWMLDYAERHNTERAKVSDIAQIPKVLDGIAGGYAVKE